MSQEIANTIMVSEESINSAFSIYCSIDELKKKLINEIFVPQLKELANKKELKFNQCNNPFEQYWNFRFIDSTKNNMIYAFEFQKKDHKELLYGIDRYIDRKPDNHKHQNTADIKTQYDEYMGDNKENWKKNDWWVIYKYIEKPEYKDWSQVAYVDIKNGKLIEYIEKKISELQSIAKPIREIG